MQTWRTRSIQGGCLPRASLIALLSLWAFTACRTPSRPHGVHSVSARELWIDLVQGDEAEESDVLADLGTADVVYIGEYHAIARHHEIQLRLLQELHRRGIALVLCLEQLEAADQPGVDRYARGELDFATFAREIDWAKKWRNYTAYEALCEFARQHQIPIRALNAPPEIIRAVSRGGGVARLPANQRAQLPVEIQLDDPGYEQLTNLELAAHMGADAARLRPMFEAQVARDETMATNIVTARRLDPNSLRTAFVVLGAGHMRYGLGTAARVRRRDPGVVERLVLISESGQLQLSEAEKAGGREVTITHGELRRTERPPADYLRVLPLPPTLPAGHPAIPH